MEEAESAGISMGVTGTADSEDVASDESEMDEEGPKEEIVLADVVQLEFSETSREVELVSI